MGHGHDHGAGGRSDASPALRRLQLLLVVPLAIGTIIGLVALWPSGDLQRPAELGAPEMVRGRVTGSSLGSCTEAQGGADQVCATATVKLAEGLDAGREVQVEINQLSNPGVPELDVGDRVLLQEAGGAYSYADHQRDRPLALLAVLFAVLVVALARWKGVAALVGLAVTLATLLLFVLPAILEGRDPIAVSVVGSSVVLFTVFYGAHGVNVRSSTALAGTLISLVVTGLLGATFTGAARLTGLASEEALIVRALADQVDLGGLLLGGIIIGALGVLNDVTITQASAVWQLHLADPAAGPVDLYRRAMAVGRDHIGATVDTLVLAYAGAAMPLLVLFTLADRPLGEVATSQVVAEEVVRSLVGAIGLVLSVPITTGLAAAAVSRARGGR